MNNRTEYSPLFLSRLAAESVDVDGVLDFIDKLNGGKFVLPENADSYAVPDLSHPSIFDRRVPASVTVSADSLASFCREFSIPDAFRASLASNGTDIVLNEQNLHDIGVYLYAVTGFGVLNGGAATTYSDKKKNKAYCEPFFNQCRPVFDTLCAACDGIPKGITPAYINPDGSPGFTFMQLKFRMLLLEKMRYKTLTGRAADGILPAFQMTSPMTDAALAAAYDAYAREPVLAEPASALGVAPVDIRTGVQQLYAAVVCDNGRYRLFDRAWGKPDTGLPVPGGHGRNYQVLADIYRAFLASGIRFVWLGNVDNLAYTVDPVSLAVFALSGAPAAFETSVKTSMDKKGGILVETPSGRMTCVDIGSGISAEQTCRYETEGKTLLFNCGLGLYDLAALVPLLDELPYRLPLRISVQDKDAGSYLQMEQNAWEIMGLLENPLFFAVDKKMRFIAAKMLSETILNSCTTSQITQLRANGVPEWICRDAQQVHIGMVRALHENYGLYYVHSQWQTSAE